MLALIPAAGLFAQFPTPAGAKKIPRAEYFSLDDGLSDRQVNSIIQDYSGFVWIATPNGLNRFDGYEFVVYNNQSDNPYQISTSNVQKIALDRSGNIVILHQNNKLYFDVLNPNQQQSTPYRIFPADGVKGFARALHVNRWGDILVLSIHDDGTNIYRFNSDAGEPKYELLCGIADKHSSVSPSIDLAQLNDGGFLINDSELGLRLFDAHGGLIEAFDAADFNFSERSGRYPSPASFLHYDGVNHVWLSLSQAPGIFRFNVAEKKLEPYGALSAEYNYSQLWEDKQGNMLIAQGEGLGTFQEVSRLICIRPDGALFDFSYLLEIGPRPVSAYAQDFFKTIFLGVETGLAVVQNNRSNVRTFLSRQLRELARGVVMGGIVGDGRGTVYFARESRHWYALDLKTDLLDTLTIIDRNGKPIPFGCCTDIRLDGRGGLWGIACTRGGRGGQLIRFDLETCVSEAFTYPHRFSTMLVSSDGLLYLASQPENEKGSLVTFNPETKKFSGWRDIAGGNPFQGLSINYMLEAADRRFWVATDNGLLCLDRATGTTCGYPSLVDERHAGFSKSAIFVIQEGADGHLWLGANNGVHIFDPFSGVTRSFDKRMGLASDFARGILLDENDNFWVSTNNGLSYYQSDKNQFRNFYSVDGLSHDEFNRFSFHRDENGRLYFGGVNGVNVFHAQDLLVSTPPPSLVLTRLTRYNIRKDAVVSQCPPACGFDDIVISPYDMYFQLNFMLPSFASPRRNQFRAKLERYDKDWIYLGNTPHIRYSKLPPGRYILQLNGADPNGNWSLNPISVNIRIKPIFYKTWWFVLLAFLIFCGAVYSWFKYRLEQNLQVERLRTKLSSDLHDEVSGLLAGIAMQTDYLQLAVEDFESKAKLRAIGEKSRKAMSKMSDVIWSIDSRNDRVEDLITRMREHADEILGPLGIVFHLHIGKLEQQAKMTPKVRQELYFIFIEAINNIAKHSNATKVHVYLGNNGPQFEMAIHDNGLPKSKVNGKSGQGLSNIRMRAQRIDASLEIANQDGYSVQLKMPKFA